MKGIFLPGKTALAAVEPVGENLVKNGILDPVGWPFRTGDRTGRNVFRKGLMHKG